MAEKRIGSILTNVTGIANQILKVKSDESGFEFVSPPSLPSYSITNDSTDRAINANDTNIDELADVLSTLIKDVAALYSGGVNAFNWTSSEQVWPYEKRNGAVLYCKEISLGALPNAGVKNVAHGISGLTYSKVFKIDGFAYYQNTISLPFAHSSGDIALYMDATNMIMYASSDQSNYTGYARVIYAK